MIEKFLLKGGIRELNFGYNAKREGYTCFIYNSK